MDSALAFCNSVIQPSAIEERNVVSISRGGVLTLTGRLSGLHNTVLSGEVGVRSDLRHARTCAVGFLRKYSASKMILRLVRVEGVFHVRTERTYGPPYSLVWLLKLPKN